MPIQQMLLGVGAVAKKTYVDDCFYSHVYEGNSSTSGQNITGSDFTPDLVWIKGRNHTANHILVDSVRGNDKVIYSNTNDDEDTNEDYVNSRFEGGFKVGNSGITNGSNETNVAWTWKKQEGFFDIVTYQGNASTQDISHSLKCKPGLILIKRIGSFTGGYDWVVYHRSLGESQYLKLHNDDEASSSAHFNGEPTDTVFKLDNNWTVNGPNYSYVAYLFAGGESDAATARSVDFDGSDDQLNIPDSDDWDLGNGDFTLETWIKSTQTTSGYFTAIGQWGSSNQSWMIRYASQDIGTGWSFFYSTNGSNYTTTKGSDISDGQWHHVAITRTGGKLRTFTDGILNTTTSTTDTFYNSSSSVTIGGQSTSGNYFDGQLSNVRLVKGTALYTSSFRPPTEPLTNVTNTVLLCCNNSSITGSTVTPGTITASSSPTASSDSPFDDPAGFVFGDAGDQNVIKCGSYVGNGSSTGPEINLGWEPQWVLIKKSSASANWGLWDSMRKIVTGGDDAQLYPNLTQGEADAARIDLTSTGFKLTQNNTHVNTNGETYIFCAIRRPDGYVGKLYGAGEGTSVFAMDTGNGSTTIPAFDSGFIVDMVLNRKPASTWSWQLGTRLQGKDQLNPNTSDAEGGELDKYVWDSNAGFGADSGYDSSYQAWMWKRHAGFDVVTYQGNADSSGVVEVQHIPHNLGKTPEMLWVRRRDSGSGTANWFVYHKDLSHDSSNVKNIYLNDNGSEGADAGIWKNTLPTATHFTVGGAYAVNQEDKQFIAMLFASVDGISKAGSYSGSSSNIVVNLGFQPRFCIIKSISLATTGWVVLDTVRGWTSSSEQQLFLNENWDESTFGSTSVVQRTSTGFTIDATTSAQINNGSSSSKYIYYAHA